MVALASSLLFCLGLGWALDRGLFGSPGRDFLEHLGRALAFGLGAAGVISLFIDSIGVPVSPLSVFATALVSAAILILVGRKKPRILPIIQTRPGRGLLITGIGLLLVAAFMLSLAIYAGWLRPTYQMDALVRWMFKAKALAVDGTLLGPLSLDPEFHYTHQRYPPLISHVANLPYLFSGRFDDRLASAIFPWYAVALALVLYGSLARSRSWFRGVLGAVWVAGLPILAFRSDAPPACVSPGSGAFSAMADLPLALFITCAAAAAMDAVENRRPRAYLEAGLMLAFACLTKNEGLPLAVGLFLGLLACATAKKWRTAALTVLPALGVYYLLWGRLAATFPALDENYPARISLEALQEGLHRVPVIAGRFCLELFHLPNWNLIWLAVIALLLLAGRAAWDRAGRLLLILFSVQLASYAFAFTITAWTSPSAQAMSKNTDPLPWLMDLTMSRLFLHVTPLIILAALRAAPMMKSRRADAS